MKWRQSDSGRWAYAAVFTGRKSGVRAVVSQHSDLARRLDAYSFMLYRGEIVYNSLWDNRTPYATAAEAQCAAEKFIDDGYPQAKP